MTSIEPFSAEIEGRITEAVKRYEAERPGFETEADILLMRLLSHDDLRRLVHSVKKRSKEPSHLRDKLYRKADRARREGKPFTITAENVFAEINDLAGVRLLHLHMQQIEEIHPLLLRVLEEESFVVLGVPVATTWDIECEQMFQKLGVKADRSESFYTSVHYDIKANRKSPRICELQVRTLAEEIWGETSHTINYPHASSSVACKEQLKVLARVVSSCSRLVSSIMRSQEEHAAYGKRDAAAQPAAKAADAAATVVPNPVLPEVSAPAAPAASGASQAAPTDAPLASDTTAPMAAKIATGLGKNAARTPKKRETKRLGRKR